MEVISDNKVDNVGPSKCGKTHFLCNLIQNLVNEIDDICIY